MGKSYRHLSFNDRLQLDILYRAGHTAQEIGELLGFNASTIYRELKRGRYMHTLSTLEEEERYSPDLAEEKYRKNLKAKGAPLKIDGDYDFISYIEEKIVEDHFSPYAALQSIKNQGLVFQTKICLATLYNYIYKDVFENICIGEHLPYKRRKKGKKKKVQKRASQGTSIEKRPEAVDFREEFGHWEMDTVKGKQGITKKTLLVLTERVTRIELLELLKDGTTKEVVKALDRIERFVGEKSFRENFKTITVDNGVEFSDCVGMERSRRNKIDRTKIYYCHPYSSYERGSNENQNKLVRRHIPKSMDFQAATRNQVKEIETWINDYPRKMFGGKSARRKYLEILGEEFWRGAG